jgi:hypothetical protein
LLPLPNLVENAKELVLITVFGFSEIFIGSTIDELPKTKKNRRRLIYISSLAENAEFG